MILIEFIVSMVATISFAILFHAPKNEVVYCGLTGAFGWVIYYGMVENDFNAVLSVLVSTFCLTIMARCFAVARKNPVTMYVLPGIFPIVPGAGIYYTAYYLFIGSTDLSGAKGLETLEIAGAIVFGIIFGFGIPQRIFQKLSK